MEPRGNHLVDQCTPPLSLPKSFSLVLNFVELSSKTGFLPLCYWSAPFKLQWLGQPTTWPLPVSCENTVLLVSPCPWLWRSIGRDAVFVCDSGQSFLKSPGVHFVQNSCMCSSAVRACSPEQQTLSIKCLMVLGGLWHHHWRWKTVGDGTTPCRVPCPSSFFQFFCSCGHSGLGMKKKKKILFRLSLSLEHISQLTTCEDTCWFSGAPFETYHSARGSDSGPPFGHDLKPSPSLSWCRMSAYQKGVVFFFFFSSSCVTQFSVDLH